MAFKVLCVAEKPSIAKAVAQHLSGGSLRARNGMGGAPGWIKNYDFDFDFGPPWGKANVIMTSVAGHITTAEFDDSVKNWQYPPPIRLFDAPVHVNFDKDKEGMAKNIELQAKTAGALFIWTDCDREGEYIGSEVRKAAFRANSQLEVKRAKFSNVERAHIIRAAKNPVNLDESQVNAVAARIELDLRIGYAFTRLTTNTLRTLGGPLQEATLSYGSCQFPTLGFVVDRYFKVRNFVPEPFWSIKVTHKREDKDVTFLWNRNRLFDRASVTILFERCITAEIANISKVQEKPTKKWKPLPLTTVELQKMASRLLHMNSQKAMEVAEKLYQRGFISYPRTETDRFDLGMNLRALIEKQTPDQTWGTFAQNLVNGGFNQPREGRNDDKAHPPIHPVAHATGGAFHNAEEARVYEFVTRRFLACCSEDAKGSATDVELEYGHETFHAHGLIIRERNYLDVYPYDKWTGNTLPTFTTGESFQPNQAMMIDGKTTAPGYLTEPDLIALMDANGIGTDATMAEHIAKIKERSYVITQAVSGGRRVARDDNDGLQAQGGLSSRGGRRRDEREERGGAAAAQSRGGGVMEEFIPTTLGMSLVEGYDNVGFEISLSKPFLRKEMELRMKDICEGRRTKEEVVRDSLRQYKQVFERAENESGCLKAACRKYIPEFQRPGVPNPA